jgi:hypothetical protein
MEKINPLLLLLDVVKVMELIQLFVQYDYLHYYNDYMLHHQDQVLQLILVIEFFDESK